MGFEDRRKPQGKAAVIYITAKFEVPGGGYPDGKTVTIHKRGIKLGPIPKDANPTVHVAHVDAPGDASLTTKGSTTFINNADAPPTESTAASTEQPPAASAARTRTRGAAAAKDTSTSKPSSSDEPSASNKKQPAKKRKSKKDPPIDLTKTPVYVSTTDGGRHKVLTICSNGRKWVDGNNDTINGPVAKGKKSIDWFQKGPFNAKVGPGSKEFEDMTPLEAFLLMHPKDQLQRQIDLTNENLNKAGKKLIDMQELLVWMGVCILVSMANYQGDRRDLWGGGGSYSKYLPTYDLNKTGMSRTRFEEIWSNMRWSNQPETQPEGMSSKKYRWMLVEDNVNSFNAHRASTFVPSGDICVDETMIRWYGLGGAYIQLGLPCYIDMERKPDSGAELQDAACVNSGIMIRLKIVDAAEEEAEREKELGLTDSELTLNHGKLCVYPSSSLFVY